MWCLKAPIAVPRSTLECGVFNLCAWKKCKWKKKGRDSDRKVVVGVGVCLRVCWCGFFPRWLLLRAISSCIQQAPAGIMMAALFAAMLLTCQCVRALSLGRGLIETATRTLPDPQGCRGLSIKSAGTGRSKQVRAEDCSSLARSTHRGLIKETKPSTHPARQQPQ